MNLQLAEAHRRELLDLDTLLRADLAEQWRRLPLDDAVATRTLATGLAVDLVDYYGGLAAAGAADWYDQMRYDSRVAGRYTARPVVPLIPEQVEANVRWSVGPMFDAVPRPGAALDRLAGSLQKLTAAADRATVLNAARRDPVRVRWARSARPSCCAFCAMLASRGAQYVSETTASFDSHDHCFCIALPLFTAADTPPQTSQRFGSEYGEARASLKAEGVELTTANILAKMRTLTGRS